MAEKPPSRVVFRDRRGRYVPAARRYEKGLVYSVRVKRRSGYVEVITGPVTPEKLADVTSRQEFESMPPAFNQMAEYKSKSKYKAWEIAQKINDTPRVRRKLLRVRMEIEQAGRKQQLEFFTRINRNTSASYSLFQRMNETLGLEGMFLYDKVGARGIEGRKGKKVKLTKIAVDEVI